MAPQGQDLTEKVQDNLVGSPLLDHDQISLSTVAMVSRGAGVNGFSPRSANSLSSCWPAFGLVSIESPMISVSSCLEMNGYSFNWLRFICREWVARWHGQ